MPILTPNPSSTIHESCHACITLPYIHVSHHNIHTQSNTNHPRANKHLIAHCLAQSLAQAEGSRSDETCSLRRGSRKASRNQRGISLGRDPSRLGEMFARSKIGRVAWASSRAKGFGQVPVRLV